MDRLQNIKKTAALLRRRARNAHYAHKQIRLGKCKSCARWSKLGYVFCEIHLEIRRNGQKAKYHARKEAGCCSKCGQLLQKNVIQTV